TDLRAFQARPFNRLGIPAAVEQCLTILTYFFQMPSAFVNLYYRVKPGISRRCGNEAGISAF
ncbi:MAG: hypothetical protein Q4D59_03375, partial [Erysipelotrichaceae bacterium]|nr:hypothetical protein [Erysipelotrichaceae bacterium]